MERADGQVSCPGLLIQPLHNFGGGFVGEGEGEDIFRFNPVLYLVEDFFCDYSRFARARAGEDELDAGAGDGPEPGGVERDL